MRLDLLIAFRQLRRSPGTSAAAIVTLAIGVGAATAVFSFVTAVMSAASPAPDMARLAGLWSHNRGEAETKTLVSTADFVDWSSRQTSFDAVAAWRSTAYNVSGAETAFRAPAVQATSRYFDIFGWSPASGRLLTQDDAAPGAPRAIVVSHAFWQTRLGGRADVLGLALRLDGEPATIVGVLPRLPAVTGFFVPLPLDAGRTDRSTRTLFVIARLRNGVPFESARAEMAAIGRALEDEFPATNRGWGVNTRPLQEEFVGPEARLVFGLLIGIVTAVFLIACVNVSNLLLARGLARQGEFGVRLALGAGAWRVTRQLLVESGLIAVAAGILSIAVARWTIALLTTLGPVDSPWIENGGLNPRALVLASFIALCATVLAGIVPARAARRASVAAGLQAAGRTGAIGARRLTRGLVAGQIALAVTLLIVAGLASRTLLAIERLAPGFDLGGVLTAAVTLPDAMPDEASARWIEGALDRARGLPGVQSAGATSRLPFAGGRWNPNRGLEIEGQAIADPDGLWAVDYVVTPGLLESLRVPLIEGRTFARTDADGAQPVALVSQTMARRFWPGRSPLGARLRQGGVASAPWRTVIGVVGDIRNDDADRPPLPYLYLPLAQSPVRSATLTLKTTGDPAALAEPLRRAIRDFDADQPLYDVRTMRQVWEADLQGTRTLIRVMAALALIALGLAAIGVWGIAAHAVGQRTREIGMRIALGARPGQVGLLVVRQALAPIAIGLGLGLAGGLGLGQMMRSILFQVTPTDPVTVVWTIGVLAAAAGLATIGPALRAARTDPVTALR